MAKHADPVSAIGQLKLDDPAKYTADDGEGWLRAAPAEFEQDADPERYRRYADRSCDLTMRGGTTSGVIYPLAVCSLAQRYVFRSVGGASAGAIAASAAAAAEYGRFAVKPEQVPDGAVRPGFAGLAELIGWLTTGTGAARWRLAQLFQPHAGLHRFYRLVVALMQKPETTGRNRFASVLLATLCMVGPLARVVVAGLFVAWLAGPLTQHLVLTPDRWDGTSWPVAAVVAGLGLLAAGWTIGFAARGLRWMALVLLAPLAAGAAGLVVWGVSGANSASGAAWLLAGGAQLLSWLLLSFGVLAAFAAIYGKACWPVVADADGFGYGIVPGAEPYTPNWLDRMAGMPHAPGVPPLAVWLADRIDDLAGIPPGADRHALTFGDLWLGPDGETPPDREGFERLARNNGLRVINLALMTTDLSAGRPFRMPFEVPAGDDERWQFCARCLTGLVPDRVVRQLTAAGTTGVACPRHPDSTLHWLPEPWDVPVVLAVRMSLAMPGLIRPVPLCRQGRPHWFSDGGITSNFPIHFFDTLLPRWPTFGLNLDKLDAEVTDASEVHLPKQDDSRPAQPWSPVNKTAIGFVNRILDTFLGWRDAMQAALPGFRGRIVSVRQGRGEGGMNLFMPPEVVATLALRGYQAGEELKHRFVADHDGVEAPGRTQTDRYRWIRMRIALREYRELASQAKNRSALFRRLAADYEIPEELAGWFAKHDGEWPLPEPYTARIDATFTGLTALADTELAEPFDGTAPIDPVLRLNAPE